MLLSLFFSATFPPKITKNLPLKNPGQSVRNKQTEHSPATPTWWRQANSCHMSRRVWATRRLVALPILPSCHIEMCEKIMVGGWTNPLVKLEIFPKLVKSTHLVLKICSSISETGNDLPNFRGETTKKSLSCHHLDFRGPKVVSNAKKARKQLFSKIKMTCSHDNVLIFGVQFTNSWCDWVQTQE